MEVKFRGKYIDGGEWIYGFLMGINDQQAIIYIPDKDEEDISDGICYKVDPKTVGRFIGTEDKNGVDIFSGDIVKKEVSKEFINSMIGTEEQSEKIWGTAMGVVYYNDASAEYAVQQFSGGEWTFYGPEGKEFFWGELEVMGNNFDNHELRENQKK